MRFPYTFLLEFRQNVAQAHWMWKLKETTRQFKTRIRYKISSTKPQTLGIYRVEHTISRRMPHALSPKLTNWRILLLLLCWGWRHLLNEPSVKCIRRNEGEISDVIGQASFIHSSIGSKQRETSRWGMIYSLNRLGYLGERREDKQKDPPCSSNSSLSYYPCFILAAYNSRHCSSSS